jgi:ribonuclease D
MTFKPGGFIDIQTIARNYGIMELSLQKIYAILFDKKISKSQRLTNWENAELTEQQQRYAATDAWASLQIYLQLMTEKKLSKKEVDKMIHEKMLEQQALNPRIEIPEDIA